MNHIDQYWSRSAHSLLEALHSAPDGLSAVEAKQRLEQEGIQGPSPSQTVVLRKEGCPREPFSYYAHLLLVYWL